MGIPGKDPELSCNFPTQPLSSTRACQGARPLTPEVSPALLGLPLTNSGFCFHHGVSSPSPTAAHTLRAQGGLRRGGSQE